MLELLSITLFRFKSGAVKFPSGASTYTVHLSGKNIGKIMRETLEINADYNVLTH